MARRERRKETGWDVDLQGLLGLYSDPATQIHRYEGKPAQFRGFAVRGSGAAGQVGSGEFRL
jgi:hypothetical protein